MSAQAAVARALFSAFADSGVEHVVLSPGSRSTPFVLAAAQEPRLRLHDHVDERVAAFFCLGIARVTGRPALMLTTSGSAPAHALPAVLEAERAGLPLIVVSADRPARLQECGANQTVDQRDLFGRHVRLSLSLPEARVAQGEGDVQRMMRVVARQAAQLVAASLRDGAGPVHLNAPVDKRLEPALGVVLPEPPVAPRLFLAQASPTDAALDALASSLAGARRALLLAGPGTQPAEPLAAPVAQICAAFGLTLVTESTSGLFFAPELGDTPRLSHADALYRDASVRRTLAPDCILALNQFPVSQGIAELLRAGKTRHLAIARHGMPDAEASLELLIEADPAAVLPGLLERAPAVLARDEAFHRELRVRDAVLTKRAESSLAEVGETLTPQGVLRDVAACTRGLALGLGNGLSVRRADDWLLHGSDVSCVLHQRGLSGIDGGVSGAAGSALALGRPMAFVLGDVAFRHDLGGLAAAARLATPLVLVVVDDGGGRIFDELPIASRPDLAHALTHFTTPGPSRAEQAAALFELPFAAPSTRTELRAALARAMDHAGASLILAAVDPALASRLDHELRASTEAS